MNYSNIKLVVSDMDGTLLNSAHQLSDRFLKVFKQLKKQNIHFAVASGRQYYSLMERLEPVEGELAFIAENGAIVMENGKQLFIQPMDRGKVQEVIAEVRSLENKYLILCGKEQAYIESTDPEFMEPFLNHYEKYKVVEDVSAIDDDEILKLTVCDLSGAEENTFPYVEKFQKDLQVKLSGKIWIDFNHIEAQKGNALQALQQHYQIDREDTMAFGDFFNDVELFEQAAYSFAMENAHPKVKSKARFTAKSNDENGVEEVLEKLVEDLKSSKSVLH